MKGLRLTIGINGIVHCFEEIGKMITNGLEKARILNNANCDKRCNKTGGKMSSKPKDFGFIVLRYSEIPM